MSLQTYSSVTLEDDAVLGECGTSGYDSSLNLIVLVFASGAVSLSQIDVAFNVLDPRVGASGIDATTAVSLFGRTEPNGL